MKKKIFTIVLALCLVFSLSATAFAADGDDPLTPETSSHLATVTNVAGQFQTEGDDDGFAKENDTNGTDISVWGRITSTTSTTPVYKLDVAWGTMKFEFNTGESVWNPNTHQYSAPGGVLGWTQLGYLDNVNNLITVTNHTNSAIKAIFASNLEANTFNADPNGADAVRGYFFETNTLAVQASNVLTDVATTVESNITNTNLSSAAPLDGTGTGMPTSKDVLFALSGTPDEKTMDTFTKVGTITITFETA